MIRRLAPLRSFAFPRAVAFATALAVAFTPTDAHAQKPDIDFPLGIGLRIPQYDRVNGLTLPFGPTITWGDERVVLEPTLAYRSNLGALDLSLRTRVKFDSIYSAGLRVERGTYSNDRWIRSDLINSIWSLAFGVDSRNYYRADRGELTFNARLATENLQSELYLGPVWENAWSTGQRPGEHREPFSIFNQTDSVNGFRRPNPLIDRGHIFSAVVGGDLEYRRPNERFVSTLDARLETAFHSPLSGQFTQVTIEQQGSVQTFKSQRLELDFHVVYTGGDPTPLQRFAYLGGSGTVSTIDNLSLGGDRLFFLDVRYRIPVPVVELPFVGFPYIAPRFAMGAAGVRQFGIPSQEVGGRLGAGFLWVQYHQNLRTHQARWTAGFSVPR